MDLQLLAALLLGIATIIVIVLRTRLDAFVALLLACLVTGFIAGAPAATIMKSITDGFASTLGSIGIVIGLGVAIGKILEISGAADTLARGFLKALGRGREPWAMAGTGALVSIPVFCDSGFVIMNPLARSIARRLRGNYTVLCLALGCGMTLTHHMVPPTPGPLGVAGILGVDLGALILIGLVFTVILLPIVVAYAKWMGPKLEPTLTEEMREAVYGTVAAGVGAGGSLAGPASRTTTGGAGAVGADLGAGDDDVPDPQAELGTGPNGERPSRPGFFMASLPLLLPLLLIVLNTVATAVDKSAQGALGPDAQYTASTWAGILAFVGNPVIALIIGVVLAVYLLLPRWTPRNRVHHWLAEAAASAGLILLITGAGGSLGRVLRDTGVGDELAKGISSVSLPTVLIPFLIATLVRLAQGSGTVAMITAASVTAPIMATLGTTPLLAALACCAGSMVCSYFNDSYFWVVTRFTGLEGSAALRGWSGITTAVWAGSLPLLLIADLII